jgi:AcrR family transcriptional regulator
LEVPLDRRRRRTYTAVLDAAERLFARHGYRRTTIEALADDADVAVSSIYSNFVGGKPDVYAALAWRIAQRHAEHMGRGGQDAVAHFDNYVAFHRDNPLAVRVLSLHDVATDDSELVVKARAQIEALLDSVVHKVTASVAESDYDTDPRALVLYVWASVNGMFSLRQRGAVDEATLRQMLAIARTDLSSHVQRRC